MGKAIVTTVVDMPNCCNQCTLNDGGIFCCITETSFIEDRKFSPGTERLPNCPLKPLGKLSKEEIVMNLPRITELDVVRHFKWETDTEEDHEKNLHIYRVLRFAQHTETKEKLVIYESLCDDEVYTICLCLKWIMRNILISNRNIVLRKLLLMSCMIS